MISQCYSSALFGIDALPIQIEVDCSSGLPGFSLVGLPDSAVREARERIGAALRNSNYDFLSRRTTVNMAPADIKKEGAAYDLPLAIALLQASEQIQIEDLHEYLISGEMSLRGELRPIKGVLATAMMAQRQKFKKIIIPFQNAAEASVVEGIKVYAVSNLKEALKVLEGKGETFLNQWKPFQSSIDPNDLDFKDVKGQFATKRALEIASAGGHNFLLMGAPGGGKSMCARRVPSILPPLSIQESLEVTRIHSAAGLLKNRGEIISRRPFRSPHHTVSPVSLVGGGTHPKPGEVSLAHHGLLFLDELLEFQKPVLESLRQPIEEGVVSISRAAYTIRFPSKFMLGAALNPCPCGYLGHETQPCRCLPNEVQRYMNRLSGPLLDRIDLQIEVPTLKYEEISSVEVAESSTLIRDRVQETRERQSHRFKQNEEVHCNAHMDSNLLRLHCKLNSSAKSLLKEASETYGFSARAYDRILKLSRTIGDCVDSPQIKEEHLAEAIQYRRLDRKINAKMAFF